MSKNAVKEIKINSSNSNYINAKNSFNKRWNIKDTNENRIQLKNRCLNIICTNLNNIHEYYTRRGEIDDFCNEVEMLLGFSSSNNDWDDFKLTTIFKYFNNLDLNINENYNLFMFFLEITLNHGFDFISNSSLAKEIAEALKLSNAKVIVCKNNNKYELYPLDVEFLNDNLVIDVLSWLDNYDNTKKSFSKAIKIERTESNYRNIIDELRLSLEFLFKDLFNNDKSLENQITNIGNYLSDNNVSKEISNMYVKLIDLYAKYNNNNAKHNDNVLELEIDYIIYLTGSFIRFILFLRIFMVSF